MDRIPITSTTISSAGYDAGSKTLELCFTSGNIYQYKQVPEHHFTGLLLASSKGAYFNTFIKNRYRFRKIS